MELAQGGGQALSATALAGRSLSGHEAHPCLALWRRMGSWRATGMLALRASSKRQALLLSQGKHRCDLAEMMSHSL